MTLKTIKIRYYLWLLTKRNLIVSIMNLNLFKHPFHANTNGHDETNPLDAITYDTVLQRHIF